MRAVVRSCVALLVLLVAMGWTPRAQADLFGLDRLLSTRDAVGFVLSGSTSPDEARSVLDGLLRSQPLGDVIVRQLDEAERLQDQTLDMFENATRQAIGGSGASRPGAARPARQEIEIDGNRMYRALASRLLELDRFRLAGDNALHAGLVVIGLAALFLPGSIVYRGFAAVLTLPLWPAIDVAARELGATSVWPAIAVMAALAGLVGWWRSLAWWMVITATAFLCLVLLEYMGARLEARGTAVLQRPWVINDFSLVAFLLLSGVGALVTSQRQAAFANTLAVFWGTVLLAYGLYGLLPSSVAADAGLLRMTSGTILLPQTVVVALSSDAAAFWHGAEVLPTDDLVFVGMFVAILLGRGAIRRAFQRLTQAPQPRSSEASAAQQRSTPAHMAGTKSAKRRPTPSRALLVILSFCVISSGAFWGMRSMPSVSQTTRSTTTTEADSVVVTAFALNVRSAPNPEAAVVGGLNLGDNAIVIARRDGWAMVGLGEWISDQFIAAAADVSVLRARPSAGQRLTLLFAPDGTIRASYIPQVSATAVPDFFSWPRSISGASVINIAEDGRWMLADQPIGGDCATRLTGTLSPGLTMCSL